MSLIVSFLLIILLFSLSVDQIVMSMAGSTCSKGMNTTQPSPAKDSMEGKFCYNIYYNYKRSLYNFFLSSAVGVLLLCLSNTVEV